MRMREHGTATKTFAPQNDNHAGARAHVCVRAPVRLIRDDTMVGYLHNTLLFFGAFSIHIFSPFFFHLLLFIVVVVVG